MLVGTMAGKRQDMPVRIKADAEPAREIAADGRTETGRSCHAGIAAVLGHTVPERLPDEGGCRLDGITHAEVVERAARGDDGGFPPVEFLLGIDGKLVKDGIQARHMILLSGNESTLHLASIRMED